MNIAAITKYKHGNIYKLLQKLNWSQSELAERSGVSQTTLGKIVNLQRRPNEETANAIQRAFGEAGEYLDVLEEWPDAFRLEKGFKREEIAEIPVGNLLYSKEMLALEFESTAVPQDVVEGIEDAMSDLSPKERIVIESFMDERPYAETGKKLKVCPQRVQNILWKGIRKMRHPSRVAKLNCDLADQVVEKERKWAAELVEEQEREKEKRQIEWEKERAAAKALQEKLDAAYQKYPGEFHRISYLTYSPHKSIQSYIRGRYYEHLTRGQSEVLQWIRKYVDAEWPAERSLSFNQQ